MIRYLASSEACARIADELSVYFKSLAKNIFKIFMILIERLGICI